MLPISLVPIPTFLQMPRTKGTSVVRPLNRANSFLGLSICLRISSPFGQNRTIVCTFGEKIISGSSMHLTGENLVVVFIRRFHKIICTSNGGEVSEKGESSHTALTHELRDDYLRCHRAKK